MPEYGHFVAYWGAIRAEKKCRVIGWPWNDGVPGPGQHANIAAKTALLTSRFGIPPSHPCAISAAQNYGLLELLEKTIQALINPGQSRTTWNI